MSRTVRTDASTRDLRPYAGGVLAPMLNSEVSSMYRKILFAVDDDGAHAAATPVVAATDISMVHE